MGITCISMKIKTIGTDKIPEEREKRACGKLAFLEGLRMIRTQNTEF